MTNNPRSPLWPRHVAAIAAVFLVTAGGLPGTARSLMDTTTVAIFEGTRVDLAEGWGEAQACLVRVSSVECFRTIEELNSAEQRLDGVVSGLNTTAATCSPALRLYDGTYQIGSILSIAARGQWINLGIFGFDNRTSSYRVGACAVELASGANGSGSRYFRCLNAYCEEDVMASGWDNVLSSAYLK